MAYKGSDYYCDDSIVLRAMKEAKKTGVILMVLAGAASLIPSVIACVVLGLMILIFNVLSH